jgi:hypothetical protein
VSTKFNYDINTYLAFIIPEKSKEIVAFAANIILVDNSNNKKVNKAKKICHLLY